MIKVAFVSRGEFGGASRYLYLLMRVLNRKRFDPIIVSWRKGATTENMQDIGIKTCVISGGAAAKGWLPYGAPLRPLVRKAMRRLAAIRRNMFLARLLRAEKADLIYLNTSGLFDRFAWVGVLARRPVVTCVHNDRSLGWRGSLLAWLSDRVVTVADGVREAFPAASLARFGSKVQTIYYGIDHEAFSCPEAGLAVRRELGVQLEEFVVGIIGSLAPRKGHTLFVEMARRVARDSPHARFLVVGVEKKAAEGFEEQVRSFVRDHGLEQVVRFLGWRNDIPAVMNALDLLVMPSFNEGLPLVIFEAMAAGKPVVATRIAGNPEAMAEDVTGLLVGPGDPDALTNAVRWMIEHPEKAREMGAAGRDRVRTVFSPERMAAEYERLFEEVVGQDSASSKGRAKT